MRRTRLPLILLLIACVGVLIDVVSLQRLKRATADRSAALAGLQQVARDAQEIVNLRAKTQTVESRQRPAQDVIAQVNAVLAEVGIPSTHFKSLTPEGEGAANASSASRAGEARLLQQSLRLVLDDLLPEQIGGFLLQWRNTQSVWTTARIELVHRRPADPQSDSNRYDVTVLLSAFYLADAPSVSSSPALSLAKESP